MSIPSSSPLTSPAIGKSSIIFPSFEKAALLAREIRNPLTCIDLSINMLNSAATDPELKVYMEIIKRSSKRINELLKELLEAQEVG
jgi:signal transduction histidine kinase